MVKSTNEHSYHCDVYSFNNANWDVGDETRAIAVDISKAFDKV